MFPWDQLLLYIILLFPDISCQFFYLIPGAIFDRDELEAKTGFLIAVSNFNKRENQSFKLSAVVDPINIKDSYEMATTSKW